jgi:hypothetical protein
MIACFIPESALSKNFVFASLGYDEEKIVVDAMEMVHVPDSAELIRQGKTTLRASVSHCVYILICDFYFVYTAYHLMS